MGEQEAEMRAEKIIGELTAQIFSMSTSEYQNFLLSLGVSPQAARDMPREYAISFALARDLIRAYEKIKKTNDFIDTIIKKGKK